MKPSLQHDLVPVFIDIDILTYNVLPDRIEEGLRQMLGQAVVSLNIGAA